MTRNEITEKIVVAAWPKAWPGRSWPTRSTVPWYGPRRRCSGSTRSRPRVGTVLVEMLGLDEAAVPVLAAPPMRGGLPTAVPTDPTIYRFYEALQVYGGALKELIHEEFGDGIMSAINFSVDIQKKSHPSGDRVVVTFDGKFLPYDWVSAEP